MANYIAYNDVGRCSLGRAHIGVPAHDKKSEVMNKRGVDESAISKKGAQSANHALTAQ